MAIGIGEVRARIRVRVRVRVRIRVSVRVRVGVRVTGVEAEHLGTREDAREAGGVVGGLACDHTTHHTRRPHSAHAALRPSCVCTQGYPLHVMWL